MNILIVGNGFDLSHYLPTKYDHFMDVMRAIEEKNTGEKVKDLSIHSVEEWVNEIDKIFEKRKDQIDPDYAMNFDELFSKTRESYFIAKTKEFYLTEQINLSAKDVLKLQYRLKLNSWYQYFKNHVEEIKTWIDFEQKIEGVLRSYSKALDEEGSSLMEEGDGTSFYSYVHKKQKIIQTLNYFQFSVDDIDAINNEKKVNDALGITAEISKYCMINNFFCYGGTVKNGFNASQFLNFIFDQLEQFIEIFNLYLELVVSPLVSTNTFFINSDDWIKPSRVYSFNYTNTYQRLHDTVEVEYLHGSHGVEQNIVLGVSDLKDESLKKIKAYGFTKYHQKLFKDTDYLFLDGFKEKVKNHKRSLEEFERDYQFGDKSNQRKIFGISEKLNLNFYIWGHSLDVSDKDYILDLFSLNDDMDRSVRVTVYYFNKNAKFDLLNNLLAILGKDKVEHWMKNKWLQFKENPKIVAESAITLEDLPKT
ncbi:AbiH family protein [Acinetobacter chinensis]|uniref:AbiH family protein n=1 Tax=Acinetobacter chinensis TaxID=2004650 RepID=UPI002934BD0B|nr:AbiH family protein [Acinetobacter chinensis]WOE41292.1 AbiH family protein [Acinetobacter chinensis]